MRRSIAMVWSSAASIGAIPLDSVGPPAILATHATTENAMKVGITCGGIGPYASGVFLSRSALAAERAGFTHYVMPDHVVQFAAYPESIYPYAKGSGQELPEQSDDAPLQFGDDTYANVNPQNPHIDTWGISRAG